MPTVTKEELEQVLAGTGKRWGLLFAVIAATGLRIGEALALKWEDLSENCTVLNVRRSIWHGLEQEPKTPNAVRVIDIPDQLARMLREQMDREGVYLFHTKKGRPLQQRNAIRALHATGKRVGFHAFRRFRTETLRRARVPEDLIRLWLGHSKQTVIDFYAAGLEKDEAWRREWCERVGLGFTLDGLLGLQNAVDDTAEEAA